MVCRALIALIAIGLIHVYIEVVIAPFAYFTDKKEHHSKNGVKLPLSKIPKNVFQDQLSLNAGQKYCRMLSFRPLFCLHVFLSGRFTQV